jgi:hypothetical protein
MRGVAFGGLCVWRSRAASARARFLVILGGPIVTAILIPVFLLAMFATGSMPGFIPATFLGGAVLSLASLLMNGDPRPANAAERARPDRVHRDGPMARAAYQAWRNQSDG